MRHAAARALVIGLGIALGVLAYAALLVIVAGDRMGGL